MEVTRTGWAFPRQIKGPSVCSNGQIRLRQILKGCLIYGDTFALSFAVTDGQAVRAGISVT